MNKERLAIVKGERKLALEGSDLTEQTVEVGEYCDIDNCGHPSKVENWLEWIVKHNNYATTDTYAHYCDGHFTALYALYGKRRIEVAVEEE